MESWKTLAVPWNAPVMVAGRLLRGLSSISSVACPSDVPGLSANEIVTEGNWPECGMLCGPASPATSSRRSGAPVARYRTSDRSSQPVGVSAGSGAAFRAARGTDWSASRWWKRAAGRRRRRAWKRRVPVDIQRGGAIAVQHDVDRWIADLQIARDFGQPREPRHEALELLGLRVELRGIRAVECEIVGALGHAAAHADRLRERR